MEQRELVRMEIFVNFLESFEISIANVKEIMIKMSLITSNMIWINGYKESTSLRDP